MAGVNSPPVVVIGPQFCAPYPVDLTMVRKLISITDGNFAVADVNGNLVFKVKGKLLTIHDRRILLDSQGNPIVSLRQKVSLISLILQFQKKKNHLFCILQHPFFTYQIKFLPKFDSSQKLKNGQNFIASRVRRLDNYTWLNWTMNFIVEPLKAMVVPFRFKMF